MVRTSATAKGASAGELREVPGPNSQRLKKELLEHEVGGTYWRKTFDRPERIPVFESQAGIYVTDVDGNQYIEAFGAFHASCLGYAPEELIEPVHEQQRKLMHLADMPSEPRAEAVKALAAIAPGELKQGKVQFELGGGPAVELALKLAWTAQYPRRDVISFFGGYHGRTAAANHFSASAYDRFPFPGVNVNVIRVAYPYCYRCFYEKAPEECDTYCARYIEKLFQSPEFGVNNIKQGEVLVAALIVEPMQMHTGGVLAPPEFYPALREICDKYGVLFVDDEIAVGVGRTGKWFACELWDTVPDIIVTSKALSGGIWPLSGIIARREVASAWDETPDKHMGTWHGNPVGCRAAVTVINEIKRRNLLEHVSEVGEHLGKRLRELQERHSCVGDVSGIGLTWGLEFVRDRTTKEPADEETKQMVVEALRRGMLVCEASYFGNRITLTPPYIISRDQVDTIVGILDESIAVAFRK